MEQNLENNKGINAGHYIIEHDAEPPVESLIKKVDRKGFPYIKYTEEGKTQNHEQGGCRDSDHGDQHTDNLINDNQAGILVIHDFFSFTCDKGPEKKYSGHYSKVDF